MKQHAVSFGRRLKGSGTSRATEEATFGPEKYTGSTERKLSEEICHINRKLLANSS
jgi:hypothetical protein